MKRFTKVRIKELLLRFWHGSDWESRCVCGVPTSRSDHELYHKLWQMEWEAKEDETISGSVVL